MSTRQLLLAATLMSTVAMSHAADGSTAYKFLNVTSSSRVYGLGGVNVSSIGVDDLNSIDQNPALLGGEYNRVATMDYMSYLGESNFAGVRYAVAVGEHGAWSGGVRYFGYGEMKGADATGSIIGTFAPKDFNFSSTYSHDITPALRGGITVKGLYSSYDEYSAFALATDLGLNYFDAERALSLSFVVTNLGGQVKRFAEVYDRLPTDVRLGVTTGLGDTPFSLSVTAWNLTRWELPYVNNSEQVTTGKNVVNTFASNMFRHLVMGIEYVPTERFYLGVGYNYKMRTDMNLSQRTLLSGFSACAGINVANIGFGVSIAQPHTGATTLMVNLNMAL